MAVQESNPIAPSVDFMELRNILMLAAFAAEARRVLNETAHMAYAMPELDAMLSSVVTARNQWDLYEDTLPEVLDCIAKKFEAMQSAANEGE